MRDKIAEVENIMVLFENVVAVPLFYNVYDDVKIYSLAGCI